MQPDWVPEWLSISLDWVHREQALVAGLLALIGAAVTVAALRQQIKIQERQWHDEKNRRHRANRARLPLALSDLIDYCLLSYSICKQFYENYNQYRGSPPSDQLPFLPGRALEILSETIEVSLCEEVSLVASDIISELQVMDSRLRNSIRLISSPVSVTNINNREVYALRASELEEIQAQIGRLFEYARREKDGPIPLRNKQDAERDFCFGKPAGAFEAQVVEYIRAYWPE